MLVLSRKLNQEIVIGNGIKVRILKIKGNTVRLGIDAPRDVKVLRGELPSLSQCRQPAEVDKETKPSGSSRVERPSIVSSESDQNSAEITVVFSNDAETPAKKILPFPSDLSETRHDPQPKTLEIARHQNKNSVESPTSIQYRERLPESLGHNRLKEIVKHLTNKK